MEHGFKEGDSVIIPKGTVVYNNLAKVPRKAPCMLLVTVLQIKDDRVYWGRDWSRSCDAKDVRLPGRGTPPL